MYPSSVISALIPDNAFSLIFPHKFFLIMHINICSPKYINVHPNGRHNYTTTYVHRTKNGRNHAGTDKAHDTFHKKVSFTG